MLSAGFSVLIIAAFASLFFLDHPIGQGSNAQWSNFVMGFIGVALFSLTLLGSLYAWASTYIEQLTIGPNAIVLRTLFRNRQIDPPAIQSLTWSLFPREGSILLGLSTSSVRLYLASYSKSDQLRIVRVLRQLVAAEHQQGWPKFCRYVALPLRDGRGATRQKEPGETESLVTRKRYDRLLAIVLPLSLIMAVVAWWGADLWQFAVVPALVLVAWVCLRSRVPAGGRAEIELTSTTSGVNLVIVATIFIVGNAFWFGSHLAGFQPATGATAFMAVACIGCLLIVSLRIRRRRRRQKNAEADRIQQAVFTWMHGEEQLSGSRSEVP